MSDQNNETQQMGTGCKKCTVVIVIPESKHNSFSVFRFDNTEVYGCSSGESQFIISCKITE